MTPQTTKTCSGCHKELPIFSFDRDHHKRDGLCARCRDCRQIAHNASDVRDPQRAWARRVLQRRRRRGYTVQITPLELAEMARSTPYCSLCRTVFEWIQGSGQRIRPNKNTPCLLPKAPTLTRDTVEIICYPCWSLIQKHQPSISERTILSTIAPKSAPQELRLAPGGGSVTITTPQDDTHPPPPTHIPVSCGAFLDLSTDDFGAHTIHLPPLEKAV